VKKSSNLLVTTVPKENSGWQKFSINTNFNFSN
jgi:hypothetical protein